MIKLIINTLGMQKRQKNEIFGNFYLLYSVTLPVCPDYRQAGDRQVGAIRGIDAATSLIETLSY
jgi:hypothetical protein